MGGNIIFIILQNALLFGVSGFYLLFSVQGNFIFKPQCIGNDFF